MRQNEALYIVELVMNGWPQHVGWTGDQMAAYASAIEDLDARFATKAVARAVKEMRHRPSVAELREYTRMEARAAESWRESPEVSLPPPPWVLQWARARSKGDMRPLIEQALAIRELGDETPDAPHDDRTAWIQPDEYLEGPIGNLLGQLDLARAMPA